MSAFERRQGFCPSFFSLALAFPASVNCRRMATYCDGCNRLSRPSSETVLSRQNAAAWQRLVNPFSFPSHHFLPEMKCTPNAERERKIG